MLAALITCLLPNDLDKILDDAKLAGAIESCTVADETSKVIYERNSGLRVVPASNEKLLTNSFALHTLGPDFRPKTRLWKLRDRVVVDSPGDPMMTHERLERAAAELGLDGEGSAKISPTPNPLPQRPFDFAPGRHLRSTLRDGARKAVDVHEAYRPLIGPSWEWDDLPNKYAAPVCAFTVDRGSVELWAQGDKLWVLPRYYWLEPKRGVKTGPKKVVYDPIRRTLTVDGELPKTPARIDTLALDQPDMAASAYLGRGFRVVDTVPKRIQDLTLVGPPLRETMKDCLVHSDNNLAENLLLMASASIKPLSPDPYGDAAKDLMRFLTQTVGEQPGDFHSEDGSGMSRHDLVTTGGIVRLLVWALKQPTKDVWLDALAKPGTGTLADRLKDVPFTGKTGTLDMVVALSGYVHTKKDRTLVVSLIFNHFACKESEARSIADSFAKKLAEDDGFGINPAPGLLHEARPAQPCHRSSPPCGDARPRVDGGHARERADRRAQSLDAPDDRPKRMAVRGGQRHHPPHRLGDAGLVLQVQPGVRPQRMPARDRGLRADLVELVLRRALARFTHEEPRISIGTLPITAWQDPGLWFVEICRCRSASRSLLQGEASSSPGPARPAGIISWPPRSIAPM